MRNTHSPLTIPISTEENSKEVAAGATKKQSCVEAPSRQRRAASSRRRAYELHALLGRDWQQTLSCELRNSLKVIVSAGEILLDDPHRNLLQEQKALLAKILDNAQHLNHLISSYFRPAAAKTPCNAEDMAV